MKQAFIRLMSRAGVGSTAMSSDDLEGRSMLTQEGGQHAEWDQGMEHWAAVCRNCDRSGARCWWCLAGLG